MLKALYSNVAFCETDRSSVAKIWETHTPPNGFIDETTWIMNVLQYRGSFSFVRLAHDFSHSWAPVPTISGPTLFVIDADQTSFDCNDLRAN